MRKQELDRSGEVGIAEAAVSMADGKCLRYSFGKFDLYVVASTYGYTAKARDNERHEWIVSGQIADSEQSAKQIALMAIAKLLSTGDVEQFLSDQKWFECLAF